MEYQKLFEQITDEYSSKILNWAVKKTGNRLEGEDLAQEVLMQVFIAATKQKQIEKTENFVWKIAHFVWCNKLRTLSKNLNIVLLDEAVGDDLDLIKDFIDKDEIEFELNVCEEKLQI